MTAWRKMQAVIKAAEIEEGPQACPKGLREDYSCQSVCAGQHESSNFQALG
jgi:hypothetical protein